MQMTFMEALSRPHKAVLHWLDHQHGSYAHDLEVAAMSALRREMRRGGGSGGKPSPPGAE
jgi:hypothetical protein